MKATSDTEYNQLQTKHQTFLGKFQVFPEKTRKSIYQQLLLLPLNHRHFQQLSKPFRLLPQHNLDRHVAYICGCLESLYPELGNQWVPGMIHPFVKLFKQDSIACFQISMSFLMNHFLPVMINFPEPNKVVMELFESYLRELTAKVESLNYPLSSVINPIFVVSMTDILNRNDWLVIFDYLTANSTRPWLYVCVVMVIVKSIEKKLIKMKTIEDIAFGLRREKSLRMNIVILEAQKLAQEHFSTFEQIYANRYFPIKSGRYPVFSFIQDKLRLTNKKIQYEEDHQIIELQKKTKELESLLNKHLNSALYSDQKQINDRYELVEGQVQQYLQKIKQEHRNKIQALREVENNFNQRIQDDGNKRNPENVMNALERRARLQKQIDGLMREAQSIKQMQVQMMKRMENATQIKKQELLEKSLALNKTNRRY